MQNPTFHPARFAASLLTLVLLFTAFLLPASAQAQAAGTGSVSGRVLNEGTGEYLRNAIITVVGTDLKTTAEAGGNFTLPNVPAGPQRLRITYAGLEDKEQAVQVATGAPTSLEVSLGSPVVRLEAFTVAGEREGNAKVIMEQKAALETKRVLATDTFGSISEGNVGEFLKYLPGVMIDYTEADARSVSLGGLDPKYTAVTIDGAPIASSGIAAASGVGGSRAFEFEQISISSIEAIDVSRTPQPNNPGSAMAGVVNLRTKGAFDRADRLIAVNAGVAFNSMSGNPLTRHAGWDDEEHYRLQPNFGLEYSDVFLNRRLGVRAGYNFSNTFAEQKAQTVAYAFDTDLTNNATEIPRLTSFGFRDSPKPTIRYNANLRLDFKVNPDLWVSGRAEYNRYHAKFFSRDLSFNFTTTANSPDPDGAGAGVAGPVVANTEYSLSSQTATVGTVGINQGGGGTNKYGSTANFGTEAHYRRGSLRVDAAVAFSRSETWYKDRRFGFWWSINPSALGGLGLRFNRNGPADPRVQITQTSGPDYRNLANFPNGFTGTSNDRQGEDQRWTATIDTEYTPLSFARGLGARFKTGFSTSQWINNADRPLANFLSTRRGADNTAATADENPAMWAESGYKMHFDFGGNYDGLPNLDRWALYKDFLANPTYWTAPTDGQLLQFKLQNSRDAKEQIDALYHQTLLKWRKLTVAPGVRVEHTRGEALGPTDIGDRETRRRLTGSITGTVDNTSTAYIGTRFGGGRTAAHQDYYTWLRYLHTAYSFTDNLVAKGSFNQAISRPNMDFLIGGLVVTNDNPDDPAPNRASAGNAGLKPELSDTISLSLEYYPKNVGQISVTAYRRDFSNLIRSSTVTIPAGGTFNDEPLPTSVSPLEPWEITTRNNIAKGHMRSLELSFMRQLDFLPSAFRGARINTNYTHVWYDVYDNYFRPQNIANASLFLPYRSLSLTWNTNWREGYRNEVATASNGFPRSVAESLTHTMDLSWQFRSNTMFFLTARNIFNGIQSGDEYRGRSDLRTRFLKTGAIWTAGARATF